VLVWDSLSGSGGRGCVAGAANQRGVLGHTAGEANVGARDWATLFEKSCDSGGQRAGGTFCWDAAGCRNSGGARRRVEHRSGVAQGIGERSARG
jgi:hypothetical protein